jgi:WD40 repeat protein
MRIELFGSDCNSLLLSAVSLLLLGGVCRAQAVPPPTADEARALQAQYRSERDQALKSGAVKRAQPQLFAGAEQQARLGDAALDAGRLRQAAEAYRQARWLLPYEGPHLPPHVTRVLGNPRLRHANAVSVVAFSPDGKRLATASWDRTVKVWDLANGHELLSYDKHQGEVQALAFSPDGKSIASAGEEERILLWDAATGKDLHVLRGKGKCVTCLAFSRDGKTLATGWDDKEKSELAPGRGKFTAKAAALRQFAGALRLYDTATGELKRAVEDFPRRVETLAFSADGKLLAVGSGDGQIRLWEFPGITDNVTQPAFWQKGDLNGPCFAVAFSPDGKTLARCGADSIKLYHVSRPGAAFAVSDAYRILTPGSAEALGLVNLFASTVFSKDGKTLFTGGLDGVIRLWDLDTGLSIGSFRGHAGEIGSLVFNASGTQLASGSLDHSARLWDFDTAQQVLGLQGHEGPVWSAAFSPDGRRAVSAGADSTVRVWDVLSGKVLRTLTGHKAPVTVALFSPDGKSILSAGGDMVLRLWNAETGAELQNLKSHQGTITAAAFSPDGSRVASADAARRITIWDLNGKAVTIPDEPAVVMAVAFSPDGKQLASGHVDQTIRLWDTATGKGGPVWIAHHEAVSGLAFSRDGKLLASCGADQLVKVWKLDRIPQGPITLAGHAGPLSSVAFRPDGRYLASAGADHVIKLWKLERDGGKEVQNLRGHKDWVTSVTFSRDGFYLLSASVDQTVKLWEVTTRELPQLAEHAGLVEACTISPDGKLIASGSTDRTIKVWDLASGGERFTLSGHQAAVSALAFTPDSRTLVSASRDSMRFWDMATAQERPRSASQDEYLRNFLSSPPVILVAPDGKRLVAWLPGKERSTTVSINDLATGKQLLTFNDEGRYVVSLTFTPDVKRAAIGAGNGTVRVFDLEKRGEMLPGGDWFVFDSKTGCGDLVFSPDGQVLYVGNEAGEVKVCKVDGREVLRKFQAHEGRVEVLTMSPDGKRLASAGQDNLVKLWDTATGKELRRWDLRLPPQEHGLVWQMNFTPDGKHLLTANGNTTMYLLELP